MGATSIRNVRPLSINVTFQLEAGTAPPAKSSLLMRLKLSKVIVDPALLVHVHEPTLCKAARVVVTQVVDAKDKLAEHVSATNVNRHILILFINKPPRKGEPQTWRRGGMQLACEKYYTKQL